MLDILMVCLSPEVEGFADALAEGIAAEHTGSGVVVASPDADGVAAVGAWLERQHTSAQIAIVIFGREAPAPSIVVAIDTVVRQNPSMLIVLAPGAGDVDTSTISGFVRRIPFASFVDESAFASLRDCLFEIEGGAGWQFRPIQAPPPAQITMIESPLAAAEAPGAESSAVSRPAAGGQTAPASPSTPLPRGSWLGGLIGRVLGGIVGTSPRSAEPPTTATSPQVPTVAMGDEGTSPVLLGASAPRAAAPGDEFTARFVAYRPELESAVKATLCDLSPGSTPHLGITRCQWSFGTVVEVTLRAGHLLIEPSSRTFTWDGTKAIIEFDVTVPDDATLRALVLKFDASIDGIVVATLRIDFEIAARGAGVLASSSPLSSAEVQAARTAFASYSSTDRQRVLDRVAAVRISAGLDIFVDCLSLHPGQAWLPRLEAEIRQRDLFLLFWSTAAATSEYVSWEWHTALQERGKEAMQIHPLEVGVAPPTELRDLHFGDAYMLARKATAPPA